MTGGPSAHPLLRPATLIQRPLGPSSRRLVPIRNRCSVPKSSSSRRLLGFRVFAEENRRNDFAKEGSPPAAEDPAGGEGETGGGATTSNAEGDRGYEEPETGSEQQPPPRPAAARGIRWRELLLAPDADNVVAVGLTGILAWASLQVLWQLLLISVSILVAALKYSFVAALLLFILITLL